MGDANCEFEFETDYNYTILTTPRDSGLENAPGYDYSNLPSLSTGCRRQIIINGGKRKVFQRESGYILQNKLPNYITPAINVYPETHEGIDYQLLNLFTSSSSQSRIPLSLKKMAQNFDLFLYSLGMNNISNPIERKKAVIFSENCNPYLLTKYFDMNILKERTKNISGFTDVPSSFLSGYSNVDCGKGSIISKDGKKCELVQNNNSTIAIGGTVLVLGLIGIFLYLKPKKDVNSEDEVIP